MKDNYSFMPSRELKEFFRLIENQYGAVPELFKTTAFIHGKERIYLVARDIEAINMKNIRVNSIGLYIAELKNEQLRLSIEGSQIIGPIAKKNVYELNREQLKQWLQGQNLTIDGSYDGFVILKYENDYVGSGKYKEGSILNFVPKARRLLEMH